MSKGLDYTTQTTAQWAKAIKDQGYDFVCRYLVPEKYAWKRLTATEAEVLSHAGLNIVSVFESTAPRAGEGAAAGTADGISALQEAKKVGQPPGSTIYFAVDYDAPTTHYDAIESYLRAAQEQISGYHVGVYGSFYVCREMKFRGAANFLWQTYAWSKGQLFGQANVHQYKNGQKVSGVQVDFNDSFGGEGWWNTLPVVDNTEQELIDIEKAVTSEMTYLQHLAKTGTYGQKQWAIASMKAFAEQMRKQGLIK